MNYYCNPLNINYKYQFNKGMNDKVILFERRVGIWPSGWDNDGDMYCNQRFGDWPIRVEQAGQDPWAKPEWMLLSYGKPAKASSCVEGKMPVNATDENVQTWWLKRQDLKQGISNSL